MPYIDGLPVATSFSSADVLAVNQGGILGVPGSGTTRQATFAQVFGNTSSIVPGGLTVNGIIVFPFLPTSDAGLVSGQLWNNGGFVCVKS